MSRYGLDVLAAAKRREREEQQQQQQPQRGGFSPSHSPERPRRPLSGRPSNSDRAPSPPRRPSSHGPRSRSPQRRPPSSTSEHHHHSDRERSHSERLRHSSPPAPRRSEDTERSSSSSSPASAPVRRGSPPSPERRPSDSKFVPPAPRNYRAKPGEQVPLSPAPSPDLAFAASRRGLPHQSQAGDPAAAPFRSHNPTRKPWQVLEPTPAGSRPGSVSQGT
eukprot:RCo022507